MASPFSTFSLMQTMSKTEGIKKVVALTFVDNIAGNVTKHIFHRDQKANLASFRLQLHPALIACQKLGYQIEIWSLHNSHPEHLEEIKNVDLCIVGKISTNREQLANEFTMINLAFLARLKRQQVPILLIYSDHHCCKKDTIGYFYKVIVGLANAIVCPTKRLVKELKSYASENITYHQIEDSWHFDETNDLEWEPKINHINLLWFGATSNIQYLIDAFPKLILSVNTSRDIKLTILSTKIAHAQFHKSIDHNIIGIKNWKISYRLWDSNQQPLQLRRELGNAQLTLLPSDPKDPSKCGVSHNRFVDAIRGGTIPIASPIESYLELSELGLISDDLPSMINYAEDNMTRIWEKIKLIRDKKLARFSPQRNHENWEKIIISFNSSSLCLGREPVRRL